MGLGRVWAILKALNFKLHWSRVRLKAGECGTDLVEVSAVSHQSDTHKAGVLFALEILFELDCLHKAMHHLGLVLMILRVV